MLRFALNLTMLFTEAPFLNGLPWLPRQAREINLYFLMNINRSNLP